MIRHDIIDHMIQIATEGEFKVEEKIMPDGSKTAIITIFESDEEMKDLRNKIDRHLFFDYEHIPSKENWE